MPDQSGSETGAKGNATLQIILAVITVSGVIATALFANWDKVFGRDAIAAPPVHQQQAADAGTSAAPPPAQQGAATGKPAETPAALSAVPAQEPPPVQVEGDRPDATGSYHDTEGYTYEISQQGNAMAFRQFMNGALVGQGQGLIEGRAMRYGFIGSNGDSGQCVAQLSESGREISGRCQSAGNGVSWPFVVSR